MKHLKVLISAYACEPGKGSEPGVGWNWVMQVAHFHEVWVITRANNRPFLEPASTTPAGPRVHWIYVDLPRWARCWKRGPHGVHLYYYLWQIRAYRVAQRLHHAVGFDVTHHLTFGNAWMPSLLVRLPVPFIWGPLGGGESTPPAFYCTFHTMGKLSEGVRSAIRWCGECDPTVRLAARRATLVLAKARETAQRLQALGARHVQLYAESGLTAEECAQLQALPIRHGLPFRLVSIGRLVHWKGFHLGLLAFARLQQHVPASEYWVIGAGAERCRLERLAQHLAVADKVRFWGNLPRQEVLAKLAECDVLVHPSLHDSGGWVCPEAMAAGRPVICLDLGGPAGQVTEETGIKIPVLYPEQVIMDMAQAMHQLALHVPLRVHMGAMARHRAAHLYTWPTRGPGLARLYEEAMDAAAQRS